MQTTTQPSPVATTLLYAEKWHSATNLKARLRSEIKELRHTLAKLENSLMIDDPESFISPCSPLTQLQHESGWYSNKQEQYHSNMQTLSIYRNMIYQRERMYYSIR